MSSFHIASSLFSSARKLAQHRPYHWIKLDHTPLVLHHHGRTALWLNIRAASDGWIL